MHRSVARGQIVIENGDVSNFYEEWPSPVVIVSDGPYGVSSFPGDPDNPYDLADWYEPHIKAWSKKAGPSCTLWFWNTEIGWATVHPILLKHGWEYKACNVWDKGIAHVAGNSNTKVLRQFPIVTEVCVQYTKRCVISYNGKNVSMKHWLRKEWQRTKMPLNITNKVCGVKDAATRKYFTQCNLWYYPPVEAFEKLVKYANEHGDPKGRPYFSLDGITPLTGKEWKQMRAKFYCEAGVTNVWHDPALRGQERIKNGSKCVHINQKPLKLIERMIKASSDYGDMVWEPFGGLCSGAIASYKLGRKCRSAEIIDEYWESAQKRLLDYDTQSTFKSSTDRSVEALCVI